MKAMLSRFLGSTRAKTPHIVHRDMPRLKDATLSVAYFAPRAGGDFHGSVRVGPTRFLFGLLDVAGKRATSGPILEAAQACFRAAAEDIFCGEELNESEAMIELARRLNLEIMRAAGGVRSCPAFLGCYNEEVGTVCYVNAGHTPGLLRDHASVVELPATGLPFGLFSLAPTDARIVGLGPEGSIAVVSRGVVEAECKHSHPIPRKPRGMGTPSEFGLAGVKDVMQAGPASARELSQRILEEVQAFMHTAPKHNDVTVLTLIRSC